MAGVTFYGLLWAAAANDQIAYHLHLDLYTVTWIFRVLVLAGPALAFVLTRVICHALADRRRDEELHGRETGRIVMNPQGGYTEIREPAHRAAPPSADPPGRRPPAQILERRPDAMDRSSLIVVVMPIMTLIALFTGIALPFIAASRSGAATRGGGWHAQMR